MLSLAASTCGAAPRAAARCAAAARRPQLGDPGLLQAAGGGRLGALPLRAAALGRAAPAGRRRGLAPQHAPRAAARRGCATAAVREADALAVEAGEVLQEVARAVEDDPAVAGRLVGHLDEAAIASLKGAITAERAGLDDPAPPSRQQLQQVGMAAMIPFIGFGMLDNALMIVFGEWIDVTLCVFCGFSTMAAAALGNTLSDAGGVFSGAFVESMAAKIGLKAPPLSRSQEAMDVTKTWERLGQVLGVIIGCLFGMLPLLFLDTSAAEKKRRERAMHELWQAVIDDVAELLNAEASMMMMVDEKRQELYTWVSSETIDVDSVRSPLGEGVKGEVAKTGEYLNIEDVAATEWFSPERHMNYKESGIQVKSILCMPILDPHNDDKVLGVIEVVNKRTGTPFTEKDEDVLSALCSHITTALGSLEGSEQAFRQTMKLCKRCLERKGRLVPTQNSRTDVILNKLVQDVARQMDAEATQLLLIDEHSAEIHHKVASGAIPSSDAESNRGPGTVLGACLKGKGVVIDDVTCSAEYRDDPRLVELSEKGLVVKSLASIPILNAEDKVVGILECINKRGSRQVFSSEDVWFLSVIAEQCAMNLSGPGSSLSKALKMVQHGAKRDVQMTRDATLQMVLDKAFDEVDRNKDGMISREEWNAAAERIFRSAGSSRPRQWPAHGAGAAEGELER